MPDFLVANRNSGSHVWTSSQPVLCCYQTGTSSRLLHVYRPKRLTETSATPSSSYTYTNHRADLPPQSAVFKLGVNAEFSTALTPPNLGVNAETRCPEQAIDWFRRGVPSLGLGRHAAHMVLHEDGACPVSTRP